MARWFVGSIFSQSPGSLDIDEDGDPLFVVVVDVLLRAHIFGVFSIVRWFGVECVTVVILVDPLCVGSSHNVGVEGFPMALSLLVSPISVAVAFLFDRFLNYDLLGCTIGDGYFSFFMLFLDGMAWFLMCYGLSLVEMGDAMLGSFLVACMGYFGQIQTWLLALGRGLGSFSSLAITVGCVRVCLVVVVSFFLATGVTCFFSGALSSLVWWVVWARIFVGDLLLAFACALLHLGVLLFVGFSLCRGLRVGFSLRVMLQPLSHVVGDLGLVAGSFCKSLWWFQRPCIVLLWQCLCFKKAS